MDVRASGIWLIAYLVRVMALSGKVTVSGRSRVSKVVRVGAIGLRRRLIVASVPNGSVVGW